MHRKVADTINIHIAPSEIDIYLRISFIPVSLINDCNTCEYNINKSFRACRFDRYCGCRVVSYCYDGMLKLFILLLHIIYIGIIIMHTQINTHTNLKCFTPILYNMMWSV